MALRAYSTCFVFRARDHRGLDGDLQAEDDRRRTRRAAAQRRTLSQRLSCLARNGRSPGEESCCDSVAAQTIEAQPVFGQIEPSQRPGASRADTQSQEKRWLISVVPCKGLERLGVEKETECGKNATSLPRETSEKHVLPRPCGVGLAFSPSTCSEETITFLRSGPEHTLRADLRKPVRYREWQDYPSRVAAARTG